MRINFTERTGRIEELDRSFDLKFWQAQDPKARFAPAGEFGVHLYVSKGKDVRRLRLHRAVENFQRQRR